MSRPRPQPRTLPCQCEISKPPCREYHAAWLPQKTWQINKSISVISLGRHQLYEKNMKTEQIRELGIDSLTFCVRIMLPERHQWKPAVQTAAVMFRMLTPRRRLVTGKPATATSHIRRTILRMRLVTCQQRAQTPPSRPFALCRYIAGWTQACN